MKRFAELFRKIDSTTKTTEKIKALSHYLNEAPDDDKLWTIALFSHRRPKRTISTTMLRAWCAEFSDTPTWLFEECYHIVGDLAETISLLSLKRSPNIDKSLSEWIEAIKGQKDKSEEEKKAFIFDSWGGLSSDEIFLFNKIITGGFRVGVSQKTIAKALSIVLDIHESNIAHKLMGNWTPDNATYHELLLSDKVDAHASRPYPFYLAYSLESKLHELGSPNDWQVEYKWDGIRSQLIKRQGEIYLWSRGEELVTPSYPEFQSLTELSEDNFVIDGELVVFTEEGIQSFNQLQKRIGRKTISKKFLKLYPCAIICYDLLEHDGLDIRDQPLSERRRLLEQLISTLPKNKSIPLLLSEIIEFSEWDQLKPIRENARENRTEGLMLKLKSGTYRDGRKKGEVWKWKVDPLTVDAVMLYAQRGHGRRSNLFSDFTFAVWSDDDTLVPFAKAYSGLTDVEFGEITRFVNQNTIEKFGPVRSVKPELVFEIAFEGINTSTRHKSGIALRFPRIKSWRRDKSPKEANTLDDLKSMLKLYEQG